jgi:ferredoxin
VGEWIPVPKEFVEIDKEKCTGCGHCLTICGGEVFTLKDEKAVVARIDPTSVLSAGTAKPSVHPVQSPSMSLPEEQVSYIRVGEGDQAVTPAIWWAGKR